MQDKARSQIMQRPKGILKNFQSESPEKRKINESLIKKNQLNETNVNEESLGHSDTSKSMTKKRV